MILPGVGASGVGAVVASGSGSGGGVGSVALTDQSIVATGSGATQTATYQVNTSGVVERGINGTYNTLETWLLSGAAADYDVQATLVDGSVTGSATGSWLNLGTTRTWSRADPTANGVANTATLYIEIRQAVSPFTVLASANVDLYAERF